MKLNGVRFHWNHRVDLTIHFIWIELLWINQFCFDKHLSMFTIHCQPAAAVSRLLHLCNNKSGEVRSSNKIHLVTVYCTFIAIVTVCCDRVTVCCHLGRRHHCIALNPCQVQCNKPIPCHKLWSTHSIFASIQLSHQQYVIKKWVFLGVHLNENHDYLCEEN